MLFLPLLAELLPILVGEGGMLSGLLGRAGLAEAATGAEEAVGTKEVIGTVTTHPKPSHFGHMSNWINLGGGRLPSNIPPIAPTVTTPLPGQPTNPQYGSITAKTNLPQTTSNANNPKSNSPNQLGNRSVDWGKLSDFFFKLSFILPAIAQTLTGMVTFFPKLVIGLKNFAEGVSESNRELGNWNGSLAVSFGQLDLKRQQLLINQGQETSGSGVMLNQTLGELLEEIQPLTNAATTAVNLLGVMATNAARAITFLAKLNPWAAAILQGLKAVETAIKPDIAPDDMGREGLQDLRNAGGPRKGERDPDLKPLGPRDPITGRLLK